MKIKLAPATKVELPKEPSLSYSQMTLNDGVYQCTHPSFEKTRFIVIRRDMTTAVVLYFELGYDRLEVASDTWKNYSFINTKQSVIFNVE